MVFRLSLKQGETANSILAVFHQIGLLNISGRLIADQRCFGRREVATALAKSQTVTYHPCLSLRHAIHHAD
jgi:hypothetical protein